MTKAVFASLAVGLFLLGLCVGAVAGYFYATSTFRSVPPMQWKKAGRGQGPVAKVHTASIEQGRIESTVVAYGTVETIPSAVETFSVPFESQIERVLVAQGQPVAQGDTLVTLKPSPESLYMLESARADLEAARSDLDQVKERVKLNLATEPELVQAQSKVDVARIRVTTLENRGIETTTAVVADSPGIVYAIPTERGQLVTAGAPIIETSPRDRVQVVLGVEPEDVPHLSNGEPVTIRPVGRGSSSSIAGTISLIAGDVDPATRLVKVYVAPDESTALRLNQYVTAEMSAVSANALLVPRSAVLPEQGSWILFTIDDGAAHRHRVRIGLEEDGRVEVSGDTLRRGQTIVTVGNAELQDGMQVEIQP